MYSVLIKDARTNNYRFLIVKKEEIEPTDQEDVTRLGIKTGRDDTITFATSSLEKLERKCIELLKSYKSTDIIPVNVLDYSTDLVWGFSEDANDKEVFEQEDVDFSDFFTEDEKNDTEKVEVENG